MTPDKTLPDFKTLDELLRQQAVAMTASEMHGLITGLLCGGNTDNSWLALIHDLTNEGMAFSQVLAQPLRALFNTTFELLDDTECQFNLLLPDDEAGVFARADELAGWVNHFLLGLGVADPKFSDRKEVKEIVTDLREIGMLGYDEAEDAEELDDALEEVIEYVRVAVQLCYISLAKPRSAQKADAPEQKPTLH